MKNKFTKTDYYFLFKIFLTFYAYFTLFCSVEICSERSEAIAVNC